MALDAMTPGHRAGTPLARPVELVCFALVVGQAVYLATAYVQGIWVIAPGGGHGVPPDFVNIWAAGRLALSGHAAAAYDWPAHKLMEENAVGHSFNGYYALVLSADIFICRHGPVFVALRGRLLRLDVRHFSYLSRRDPRRRRRAHRL